MIRHAEAVPNRGQCDRVCLHVSEMWPQLTRSIRHAVEAVQDPKAGAVHPGSMHWLLYVSACEDPEGIRRRLHACLNSRTFEMLEVRTLPGEPEAITEHGLLYLPDRYVVPGGRFNEMYGWDSYFIALGLLRDGRVGLAQSLTDQCLYEVEHYGAVLNCNRTYCLARSHPPFLGRMVLAVFEETRDVEWLRRALPWVERYHAFWMVHPHLVQAIGLSRYHAFGDGPAPEVVSSEVDVLGRNHYDRLRTHLRDHHDVRLDHEFYDRDRDSLRPAAYLGDRTTRESGFDLSGRFGLCGLETRHFIPVCLNTLLWRLERDIAQIRQRLEASADSIDQWKALAESRRALMNDYLWDEDAGMFFDWHLGRQQRANYPFATTFWPLWAGLATDDQAGNIARSLPLFQGRGGLLTSTESTGCQWDAPITWAPLVLMAVEGLNRYRFADEARSVARAFVSMATLEFDRTGALFEKYDGAQASAETGHHIQFGYATNEPGFGWTNACLLRLMDFLEL
jgi:alpha,alpha-trehalase